MWRKSEDAKSDPESASQSKSHSNSPAQSATPAATYSPTAATVSRGVIIKGEISGVGDFFLDGTFEGRIYLPDGSFTAGPNAHVTAEIEAREIIVLGEVVGTLKARERVHISSTGRLTGDRTPAASSSKMEPSCTAKSLLRMPPRFNLMRAKPLRRKPRQLTRPLHCMRRHPKRVKRLPLWANLPEAKAPPLAILETSCAALSAQRIFPRAVETDS